MKAKISIILIVFSLSLLSSCSKSKSPSGDILQETIVESIPKSDAHNSVNSLDWNGTYIGTLPCADCEGIKTSLKINSDSSWQIKTQYIGKNTKPFVRKGIFKWNDDGNTITLNGINEMPDKYFVGENMIIQLDKDGNRISGALAEKYVLKKITLEEEDLTGKYWKLIELMGKPITYKNVGSKEIHIVFEAMNRNVNGFAGCNNFFGSYQLGENNKISFSKIGSTKMACLDATSEDEFFKMLEMIDNYSVNGNVLMFHKAKAAPSAKFELIEKE